MQTCKHLNFGVQELEEVEFSLVDPLLVARRPVGGQQQAGPTVTLDSLNTRPDSKSYSVELQQEEWPEPLGAALEHGHMVHRMARHAPGRALAVRRQ